ncbi:MAG: hypothetical protein GY950_22270 [bacterium]|nr:hypothetical protein [bacterium]
MRKLILTTFIVVVLMAASLPLFSHCYEVGMEVKNASLNYVSIPIRVYERDGGDRVDDGTLSSTAVTSGYNFKIDFNNNCNGSGLIRLDVGTEYVIEFHYPGAVKSLCFVRWECGSTYDTFYRVTPTTFTHLSGSCEEEYSYPDCSVIYPLSVSLVIYDTDYIGSKIIYYLRATASGGNQSYTFSWSGASRTSATAYTNPNTAKRTILSSQTTTVTVTVTSNGQTVSKSKTLSGDRER